MLSVHFQNPPAASAQILSRERMRSKPGVAVQSSILEPCALSRASELAEHRALRCASARSVQWILARLAIRCDINLEMKQDPDGGCLGVLLLRASVWGVGGWGLARLMPQ